MIEIKDQPSLREEIVSSIGGFLLKKHWFLATAESCTGGLIAAAITDFPGSSRWFDRGFVTYSNSSKTALLDVPAKIIQRFGAVSRETVEAMVCGVLTQTPAHCAIAVTGIAGPSGGTPDKPVGTIWIGWGIEKKLHDATLFHFPGDRQSVRQQAVHEALFGLRDRLCSL